MEQPPYKHVVIITGAGISAESGLQTFRASDGLWCEHRVEDVATPEAYARDPALVQNFYNMRRRQLAEVEPNAAHHALARLAAEWKGKFTLVTQNVDDLHGRALRAAGLIPSPTGGGLGWGRSGTPTYPYAPLPTSPLRGQEYAFQLIHMHGELKKARHNETGQIVPCSRDLDADDDYRPHIVWFGEMPLEMDVIDRALRDADLFVAIGTSGNVYPAAGFVQQACHAGAHTLELNLEPSHVRSHFAEARYGRATELVPAWVDVLLG